MKKILFTIAFALILLNCESPEQKLNCESPEQNNYNENEIIFVVEMDSNNDKSEEDIAKFSQYYTDAIDENEPNSLGWGFYKSGDKTILIERYLNGEAMMQHGKNIGEGGVLETHL